SVTNAAPARGRCRGHHSARRDAPRRGARRHRRAAPVGGGVRWRIHRGGRMSVATAQQVVTFRLADDYFAADIFAVERVLRYTRPTPVPNLPDWVDGVIEYQGRVVPVIDLR